MMMDQAREIIISRSNKTIKYLKSLSLARNRLKEGRFLIEGIRITEEILERQMLRPETHNHPPCRAERKGGDVS